MVAPSFITVRKLLDLVAAVRKGFRIASERYAFAEGRITFGQKCRTISREVLRAMLALCQRSFAEGKTCDQVLAALGIQGYGMGQLGVPIQALALWWLSRRVVSTTWQWSFCCSQTSRIL